MLRPFSDIRNFALAASDGEIGKVKDLYFDDQSWTVRYVVVDTGKWLMGRKVLLAPRSFGMIDEKAKLIAVHLTKKQIEDSPSIDAYKPVSRQHELDWHLYYGYPGYWMVPEAVAFGATPPPPELIKAAREAKENEHNDPHLRSVSEVTGYSIHATDGDIGHVGDFIVDDEGWPMRYVIISKSWWPGKRVILSPEWIASVSWEESKVFVPLTRDTIKGAPEWEHSQPVTREFEERLFDYYGRRGYWPIEL